MAREDAVIPGREEFIALSCSLTEFSPETERVYLKESLGRVTAGDTYAVNTLPNRPASRMDGIAVRFDQVIRDQGKTEAWELGREYVFSNTGVAVPDAYDTVILIENVSFDRQGRLRIHQLPEAKGACVQPCGKVMQKGELLLPASTCISPSRLGLLAAGGIQQVEVLARPRVAVIPTGDELVPFNIPLPPGKNVETNGLVLEAYLKEWGAEPVLYPIIPDDKERLFQALEQAVAQSDVVLFIAGSSKGSHDYAKAVLERAGKVYVYEVAHGPAKHTSFTLAMGKPVLGIVGPPGGAELTAEWYVKPLLCKYLRQPVPLPQKLEVELLEEIKAHVPFDFYTRVEVTKRANGYFAKGINGFQTSRANSCRKGNAVLHIPGGKVLIPGERALVELRVPLEYI